MNGSAVLYANGVLLAILGAFMAVPVLLEFLLTGILQVSDFLLPMGACVFVGLALVFANKSPNGVKLETSDTFLLTSLTWALLPLFAGLPFYLCSSANLSFLDAWFEAVSALTTTGCTMIQKLTTLPRWIIFWRFLLAYIGGVGIIIMGMLILPLLRIGGMQLFRTESSEKSEKILPSVTQMSTWIFGIYTGAIFICFIGLRFCHMSSMDALCHAISAISTCGLSTHVDSVAGFHSVRCELVLIGGMLFGGSSLLLMIRVMKSQKVRLLNNLQWRGYLKTLGVLSVCLALLRWLKNGVPFLQSLRDGCFTTVSMLTTTGFSHDDYTSWGSYAGVLFLFLGVIGGCTGSTSGGIKIFRWQVILISLKAHIMQLRRPHGIYIPTYDRREITPAISTSVFLFVVLYFAIAALAAVVLSLSGIDFQNAVSAALGSLGNLGVGFFDISTSLNSLPLTAKLTIMLCMILGRLEVITLLTLLMPSFWKK